MTYLYQTASASDGQESFSTIVPLKFSLLATHPTASQQPTIIGRTIDDLIVFDDKLYAGYGDYTVNTGPIDINPFDLRTNKFRGSELAVPTEAILQFRAIGDKLYAPMTDPELPALKDVGYALYSDGTWTNQLKAPAIHFYDMATLDGKDLWIVGSAMENDGKTGKGAIAYRSTDDGNTWSVALSGDVSSPENGYERYYWIASLNGRIYMQAESVTPATPVRAFDGTHWTTGTTERICSYQGGAEVFAGYIVCPNGSGLALFDGASIEVIDPRANTPCEQGNVNDVHIGDDGHLYALTSNCIARSSDAKNWEVIGSVPSQARSIAVHNGRIYLGTTDAEILVTTR